MPLMMSVLCGKLHRNLNMDPFPFALGGNGEIVDLVYLPDQHFFGSDKIVLEASDNYSKARVEINFHVQSVEDPLIFYDFLSGLIENENEKYELFISHEDGDGLHTLNEIEFLVCQAVRGGDLCIDCI